MKYPTPSYEKIRNFVLSHPDYKQDSVISEVILIKIENQLWSVEKNLIRPIGDQRSSQLCQRSSQLWLSDLKKQHMN